MRFLLLALLSSSLLLSPVSFAGTFENFEEGAGAYLNQDYRVAWRILKPLADQGQTNTQIYIGEMYWGGNGIKQNLVLAYMWISLAKKRINPKYEEAGVCAIDLEELSKVMTSKQIAEARKLAALWKPKSVKIKSGAE